jgi:hypothetical protein
MSKKIFTIYDSKAEAYFDPLYFRTVGEALRAVTSSISDPDHNFSRYTADYVLFELGEFDENSGFLSLLSAPKNLGCLIEFVPVKEVS